MDEVAPLPVTPVAPAPPPARSKLPFVILGGVVLAAGIIGGGFWWWQAQATPKLNPVPPVAQVILPTPTPAPQPLFITLTSPSDGEVAINKEILVKGRTWPGTTVVIYTEGDQTSVESGADGSFEATVTLSKGINSLIVTAFAQSGEEATKSLDIVYE